MKLVPHEKFIVEITALQDAVDAVVSAEAELAAAGADLHVAAKHLPSKPTISRGLPVWGRGSRYLSQSDMDMRRLSGCVKTAESERGPGDEMLREARWEAMKATRDVDVDFAAVRIRHCEMVLRKSTAELSRAVEAFRAHTKTLLEQPYQSRDELACRFAIWNVLACDALCARFRAEEGYRDWPKNIVGRQGLELFDLQRKFEENRRDFTYRYTFFAKNWSYDQGPGTHWLDARLPATPCMTEAEAEINAMAIAHSISRSAGTDGGYLIETFDLENNKPGKLFIGRMVELMNLDEADLPKDAKVVDLYPPQPDWKNDRKGGLHVVCL